MNKPIKNTYEAIRRRRRFLEVLGAAGMAAALPRGAAADEPSRTLRIGYQKFNTLNILKGTGRLEAALTPLGIAVRWYDFAAGPQLLEALSAGAIDFGHAADAPSVFAQAAGKDVVYLAAERPYPKGIGLVVRRGGDVARVADLKGRRVATGRGWNAQYLLVRALDEAGLSYRDIEPVYVTTAADARATFESGRVDAVTLWDPFLAAAELDPRAYTLRDGDGLSNNRTFYLTSPRFLASHAATLRQVFGILAETDRWAHEHAREVADLLAPQLGVDGAVLYRSTQRRSYGAVPVDPAIVAEQQRLADAFLQLKLLPTPIRVADAVATTSVLA